MIEKAPKFEPYAEDLLQKGLDNLLGKDAVFQKIEEQYLYWDKIKYLTVRGQKPDAIWRIIKNKRFSLEKRTTLGNNQKNIILYNYNINEHLQQKLHYLDFNFGAGIQKEKLLSDLDREQYLNNALMEESIFSSMVEGATTTRVKAKEMLRKKKKPKNKSEQMILNNYQAIQYISEHQDENISIEKFIVELGGRLVK